MEAFYYVDWVMGDGFYRFHHRLLITHYGFLPFTHYRLPLTRL